ncbi:hypothetical protein MNV49_005782 [Pseudohyphozyma bogoriensis]|nr:hypothetical protein MNV49_005782 [Pseudohyphozyma bogoriensis]
MSSVARLASLIPPKIAVPSTGSAQATAARMGKVVEFYSKLPKGSLPKSSPGLNPIARYKAKYFEGPNASGAPLVHAIVGLFFIGYTIDYQMHLKHHKNGHH